MDWESSKSAVLLNPRLPSDVEQVLQSSLPLTGAFASHFWLLTSGTTSKADEYKCVALSKAAILASALSVNRHLCSSGSDVWLNPLPLFHVGGLGILARSYLSGAKALSFTGKWDGNGFYEALHRHRVTLTALVPAQLHDLIEGHRPAPPFLRGVVVGGGRLEEALYQQAKGLGWPVLPSYGLTEASSQVATAVCGEEVPTLALLKHVQVRFDENGTIALKGPSLLSAYAYVKEGLARLVDPKVEGWLQTEDRGFLQDQRLVVIGRGAAFVKIGGESVEVGCLERLLEKLKKATRSKQATVLLALSDPRLGHAIHLAVEGKVSDETSLAVEQYQQRVLPFERIRRIHSIDQFPRSALGKILCSQLSRLCHLHA